MIYGNLALKPEDFEDDYCDLNLVEDCEQNQPDNIIQFPKTKGSDTISIEYDTRGNRKKVTYSNNTYATYAYDASSRVISVINHKQDESIITSHNYTYDHNSHAVSETGKTRTQIDKNTDLKDYQINYTYDALKRLTREYFVINSFRSSFGNPQNIKYEDEVNFEYDSRGNRLKITSRTKFGNNDPLLYYTTNYAYNVVNQLTSSSMNGGLKLQFYATEQKEVGITLSESTVYNYDNEGNQIKVTHNLHGDSPKTVITDLSYDHENMLISHTRDTNTTTMEYNADNDRILKAATAEDTKYLLDQGQILEEEYRDGNTKKFFKDIGLSVGNNICSYESSGAKKIWYHHDRLGRVVAMTDENGNIWTEDEVLNVWTYRAFGAGRYTYPTGRPAIGVDYSGYIEMPMPAPDRPCDCCGGSGSVDCMVCGGSGTIDGIDGMMEHYEACGGSGMVMCEMCGGSGLVPDEGAVGAGKEKKKREEEKGTDTFLLKEKSK